MAGHSQFKNIMHRKGRQDAMRSKLFAKLAREIMVSAKEGGPDPDANSRLRLAIPRGTAGDRPRGSSGAVPLGGGEVAHLRLHPTGSQNAPVTRRTRSRHQMV